MPRFKDRTSDKYGRLTVKFKYSEGDKGLEATLAAPSGLKAPVRAARAVKEPSVRCSEAVTTKVVAKPTKTVNKAVITSTNV